jgi:hypothetical protein
MCRNRRPLHGPTSIVRIKWCPNARLAATTGIRGIRNERAMTLVDPDGMIVAGISNPCTAVVAAATVPTPPMAIPARRPRARSAKKTGYMGSGTVTTTCNSVPDDTRARTVSRIDSSPCRATGLATTRYDEGDSLFGSGIGINAYLRYLGRRFGRQYDS